VCLRLSLCVLCVCVCVLCVCAININVETITLPYAFLRGPKTRPLSNDLREIKKNERTMVSERHRLTWSSGLDLIQLNTHLSSETKQPASAGIMEIDLSSEPTV
jgi:hypothetical protein